MTSTDRKSIAANLARVLLQGMTTGQLTPAQVRELKALIPAVRAGIDVDEVQDRLQAVGLLKKETAQ